ncbi:translation initiation factor eIF-2B subunit beta [Mucor ambiguus]|uniref:Translation initiation factor eIF2B subunit beta n=1 Tax=Mucor ambiguus TaxID=91626 RepID=A0A0C9N5S2_9FUNG|nr:translation initiation factor eIF-2B subunit beta [Mucor ambiguus]
MALTKALEAQVDSFILRLKTRQIIGSYEVAKETAIILRQAVSTTRWYNVDLLIEFITELGSRLVAAQPKGITHYYKLSDIHLLTNKIELAVGNIVRRVLKIIREVAHGELDHLNSGDMAENSDGDEDDEDDDEFDQDDSDFSHEEEEPRQNKPNINIQLNEHSLLSHSSMFNLLSDGPNTKHHHHHGHHHQQNGEVSAHQVKKTTYNLKPLIIQEINDEVIADLESVYKGIADQATDFIHANEVIMTIGKSRTVEEFLKRAAHKRRFQVIVAETSPTYQGHEMARTLSAAGIDTTVISDSAIFAAMPRVNKVVLGSHAVLANGGLVAVTGSHLLAAAAKHHSTPVLVCTALYKLSPLFAYDSDTFNVTVSPHNVLQFQEGSITDKVTISNPYYDYVQPGLVSLFIHNLGSAPPTYVYRLINDNYDQEDTTL